MRPRAFAVRTPTSHHGLPQVGWSPRERWVRSNMQPTITREIIDRRQPALRWSAILGGTAIAVGVWGVLQLIGIGAGLVAVDPDDATSVVPAAIGATAFSTLAPLIAMFAGGWFAARLANTWDRQVAGAHGLITWGLASVIGLTMTVLLASAVGHGASRMDSGRDDGILDARFVDIDEAMAPINERLRADGHSVLTPEQLVAAARAAHDDDGYDREDFIEEIDDVSALDKAGATRVVDQLGSRAAGIVTLAATPTPAEHDAMYAAEQAGKGMLALGVAMLLSVVTAIAGALIALRNEDRRRGPHTTAPYPVATPMEPTMTDPAMTTPRTTSRID